MSGISTSSSSSSRLTPQSRSRRDRDKDGRSSRFLCIRNNNGNRAFLVPCLLLITLWAYVGFHLPSQWPHGDHKHPAFVGYNSQPAANNNLNLNISSSSSTPPPFITIQKESVIMEMKKDSGDSEPVVLIKPKPTMMIVNKGRRRKRKSRRLRRKNTEMDEWRIPRENGTYGVIVGPFGRTEDRVFGWSSEKRSRGTCDRKGEFAGLVRSRKFLVVFHELSMTGAPLSMLELGTEILSCGGSVSAVVLSRKGGLMAELDKRGIEVIQDREKLSYNTAIKADLVIAGSAVCSSWIEPYLEHFPAGSGQIVWWIMENRREYFDRWGLEKHLGG